MIYQREDDVDTRADDLNQGGDLPQPGTAEPNQTQTSESTGGPGNVSVDEPTAGALEGAGEGGDADDDEDTSDTSEGTSEDTSDTSEGTSEDTSDTSEGTSE